MTDRLPNGELVTQAWLAAYTDVDGSRIASTLPAPEKWTGDDHGVAFLQVRALPGGGADIDLPHRRTSVSQLDGWGTRTVRDTFRPEWSCAMDLLERVRVATFPDVQTYGKPIIMPITGFRPARVLAVYLLDEPRRVEDDPSGYARMTCNLSLTWTV